MEYSLKTKIKIIDKMIEIFENIGLCYIYDEAIFRLDLNQEMGKGFPELDYEIWGKRLDKSYLSYLSSHIGQKYDLSPTEIIKLSKSYRMSILYFVRFKLLKERKAELDQAYMETNNELEIT